MVSRFYFYCIREGKRFWGKGNGKAYSLPAEERGQALPCDRRSRRCRYVREKDGVP